MFILIEKLSKKKKKIETKMQQIMGKMPIFSIGLSAREIESDNYVNKMILDL